MTGFRPNPAKSVPFPFTEDLKTEMPKNFQSVSQDIEILEREATLLGNAGGYHPWKEMVLTYRASNTFYTSPTFSYGNDYWQGGQFRRIGDMVEIRGLMAGGADNSTWGIMPQGFRPTADLIFPMAVAPGNHARHDITTAGSLIQRYGSGGGNSGFFTLSWMRYSLASAFSEGFYQVGTTGVPFQNSWHNWGGTFHNAEYRLVGDEVQLRGLVAGGASGTVVFTLPLGMRPYSITHFDGDMSNAQNALVHISPNGEVRVYGANVGSYASLSHVAFSVSGQGTNGWKSLTLLNGFTRYAADYPLPEYRLTGDVVELRGLIGKGGSVAVIAMAQIPDRDAWPVQQNMWSTHATGGHGRVDIGPDGVVTLVAGSGDYVALNGFRFSMLP